MADIYLGRIVAIGRNTEGRCAAMYRVSSRSFPNRKAQIKDKGVSIVPKEGFETDIFKNPYIAYNCCRLARNYAIVTNGSHTDPIAEKIEAGMPVRDALALSMLALDYEHDSLDTPRISAVVAKGGTSGWLAVVRKDGINVHELNLAPGECFYLSTYERNDVTTANRDSFSAQSAQACCDYMLGGGVFASFLNPVTAVCAIEDASGFAIAATDKAK